MGTYHEPTLLLLTKWSSLERIMLKRCLNGKLNKKDKKIQMTLTTILECLEEWEAPPCGGHLKL